MSAGARVLLAWAGLLLVLTVINAIWVSPSLQSAELTFATLLIAAAAVGALAWARRSGPDDGSRAIPDISFGTALAGAAVAVTLYGLAFGHAIVYIGLGLFVLAVGRLIIELRASRRSLDRWRAR